MIFFILNHTRPLRTPQEAMRNLLDEETAASLTKELGTASIRAALLSQ